MRRASGALAFLAGAALIATTTGAAIGQEESPVPDASMAPEASPEATVVEPSTLEIIDVAADKTAYLPLKGKKLKKAVAKAAPAAASYAIAGMGADDIERIVEMSQLAHQLYESGDIKGAAAVVNLATVLYRNTWSKGSDYDTLYSQIEEFIKFGDFDGEDLSLVMWSLGDEGLIGVMDFCVWPDDTYNIMGQRPEPTICEDNGGRQIRADFRGLGWDGVSSETIEEKGPKRASELLSTVAKEVDTVGIHTVVQDKTANDKLSGKKYRKARAKALKKAGPTIASLSVGGPDATAEQQVIEYVLLAREADEAGDAKAAKAFMQLALATYRSVVPKPAEGSINTEALNYGMAALIDSDYADTPGLQLMTPPDLIGVCYRPKDSECLQNVGDHTPWECAQVGAVLTRMTYEEALAADCDEVE